MTYLPAANRRWEILAPWWRCQDKTLEQQIEAGVRWFDLRIIRHGDRWHWAHGLVDLGEADVFHALDTIGECGGSCRLLLERGDDIDEDVFYRKFCAAQTLIDYPQIQSVIAKKRWVVYFLRINVLGTVDRCYIPLRRNKPWYRQIPSIIKFPFTTIKHWSDTHARPQQHERESSRYAWVYDYV